MGTADPKNNQSLPLPYGLLDHCSSTFSRVLACEYRLASSDPYPSANPFPAALLDAVAGYNHLINDLDFFPQNVLVVGDSAGGTPVNALLKYIITLADPIIPTPGGLLLVSSTLDWGCTHTGPSSFWVRNEKSCFTGPILKSGYTTRSLLGTLPESEAITNLYISAGSAHFVDKHGLYEGYPRTCFVTGGADMTLDSMISACRAMEGEIG